MSERTESACTCIMSTIPGEYGSCEGCKRNRESDPDVCPGEVVEATASARDIPIGLAGRLVAYAFGCARCEWRFVLTLDTPERFRRDLIPSAHCRVPSGLVGEPSSYNCAAARLDAHRTE